MTAINRYELLRIEYQIASVTGFLLIPLVMASLNKKLDQVAWKCMFCCFREKIEDKIKNKVRHLRELCAYMIENRGFSVIVDVYRRLVK